MQVHAQPVPLDASEDVEWEDVEDELQRSRDQAEDAAGGASTAGGLKAEDHWRARAAVRQRFWSTSHGFAMGRKLGDWERHTAEVLTELLVFAYVCATCVPAAFALPSELPWKHWKHVMLRALPPCRFCETGLGFAYPVPLHEHVHLNMSMRITFSRIW
eukprot:1159238-Pelagomonas_calceolata.AAC.12